MVYNYVNAYSAVCKNIYFCRLKKENEANSDRRNIYRQSCSYIIRHRYYNSKPEKIHHKTGSDFFDHWNSFRYNIDNLYDHRFR